MTFNKVASFIPNRTKNLIYCISYMWSQLAGTWSKLVPLARNILAQVLSTFKAIFEIPDIHCFTYLAIVVFYFKCVYDDDQKLAIDENKRMKSNVLSSLFYVSLNKENIRKLCPTGPKSCCKFNISWACNRVLTRQDQVYTGNLFTRTCLQKKTEIISRMKSSVLTCYFTMYINIP